MPPDVLPVSAYLSFVRKVLRGLRLPYRNLTDDLEAVGLLALVENVPRVTNPRTAKAFLFLRVRGDIVEFLRKELGRHRRMKQSCVPVPVQTYRPLPVLDDVDGLLAAPLSGLQLILIWSHYHLGYTFVELAEVLGVRPNRLAYHHGAALTELRRWHASREVPHAG